jgi:hypothetical protein
MLLIVENQPEIVINTRLFEKMVEPLGYTLPSHSSFGSYDVQKMGNDLTIHDSTIMLFWATRYGRKLLTPELLATVTAIYCQPTNIYTTHELGIYHQIIEAIVSDKMPNLRYFISYHYSEKKMDQFKTGLAELLEDSGLDYQNLLDQKNITPLYYCGDNN